MAIVALKKIAFCGLAVEKRQILQALQQLGCAHLIALKEPVEADPVHLKRVENALKALEYLNQCIPRQLQLSDDSKFDFDRAVDQALSMQLESRQLAEQRDELIKEIKQIEPWGDFTLPEDEDLQDMKLWFYIVPERMMQKIRKVRLIWEVVKKDDADNYIVVINSQEPSPSSMPVARTHVSKVPLSKLRHELERVQSALEKLHAQRQLLTRWINLISAGLAAVEDQFELNYADSISIENDGIFIIQAWIPETSIAECVQFAEQHKIAITWADPETDETPPTLLKNPEYLASGEDLISIYYPPGYFGWDPSIVVFFSFTLFFAMILSDAGYAALFALLLGINWPKLGRAAKARRLRMLALVTIVFSAIWGVLVGSYFGYTPEQGSVLNELKLVDINNFNAMLRLSVYVGVAHIAIANVVMFYHFRSKPVALAYIGWLVIIAGGFLLWHAMTVQAVFLQRIAYGALAAGALLLLLFSGERTIVKPIDWFWRLLEGCKSLVRIIGLFGDVLSYMRLFALGLASASLALAFNQLAVQAYYLAGGAGVLLSIFILLFGHGLNLLLCLMSGFVHGLRLNFIEFYNWGVYDEGYTFRAFAKKGSYQ